jgi:hypothetical protein
LTGGRSSTFARALAVDAGHVKVKVSVAVAGDLNDWIVLNARAGYARPIPRETAMAAPKVFIVFVFMISYSSR